MADGSEQRWFGAVGEGGLAPVGIRDGDEVGEEQEVRAPGWLEGSEVGSVWWERVVPERFRGARVDPGRRGVVTLAVVGLIAAVITSVVVFQDRPVAQAVPPVAEVRATSTAGAPSGRPDAPRGAGGGGPASAGAAPTASGELVVSVVGLVHSAGLIRLPEGSRVADAIAAAGGVVDGADLTYLNLAQRLGDGDQVHVGPTGSQPGAPQLGSVTLSANARNPTVPTAKPGTPTGRIDLNKATESDLDALPGVGPVTAHAIIAWRTTKGRFTSVDQLGDIDGIGPTRLARLRELVTI